jgi:hypothetical protein
VASSRVIFFFYTLQVKEFFWIGAGPTSYALPHVFKGFVYKLNL